MTWKHLSNNFCENVPKPRFTYNKSYVQEGHSLDPMPQQVAVSLTIPAYTKKHERQAQFNIGIQPTPKIYIVHQSLR